MKKVSVFAGIIWMIIFQSASYTLEAQRKITGTVTSVDGVALERVTVTVLNTGQGTLTAVDGSFSIFADSSDVLVISAVGMQKSVIPVRDELFIRAILQYDFKSMEEVVTVGYGTLKRKDLTGAISSLSDKEFNKGVFTAPDQLIQGKIAGLQITRNNGSPGGSATIKIRGNSALSGSGQPLYVLDGVPLDGRSLQAGDNPLNFISPSDIASVDVLKDASASAIFGARSAYGVIIINTKKGQVGQPKISASFSAGISSLLKRIEVLSAAQFREALPYYGISSDNDHGGNEDALEAITQHGVQMDYSIGISGGNDNGKYRLSFNALDQKGILRRSDFKKYGTALSAGFKFLESKKLGLEVTVNASQYLQNASSLESGSGTLLYTALKWNPTDSLKNTDGSLRKISGLTNPLAITEMMKNNSKVTTVLASLSPYFKLTSWLEYKMLLGITYSTGIGRISVHQDITPPGQLPGSAGVSNRELTTRQITHTLNFNNKIGGGFTLTALAGFEYTQFKSKGFAATGYGEPGTGFGNFGIDYTNYLQFSHVNSRSISSFADPTSDLQSFFGRTLFNYRDRYLLTATLRADGSSKFGSNNKYGVFPSFAVAWHLSKEKFFKTDLVNSLKIRAGWGITGNQEFPAGSAQAKYSFFDGGIVRQVNNPNPELKWQSDKQFNAGLDFAILENRIWGTIDYFDKTTTNLLFPSPPIQPAPLNSTVRWINLDAQIKNRGLELLLNSAVVSGPIFSVDLGVNATFLKNRVTDLMTPLYTGFVSGPVQVIQNGHPMNTFYTRRFIGLDKATGFSVYENDGSTFYYVGNPNPKLLLGINGVFRYKVFSVTANLYGAYGQDIFYVPLMNALNIGSFGGSNIGLSVFKDPTKEAIANPVTPSSRYIFKGNYLKMANLTLNYALGNFKFLKDVNVYVTAQNLFLLTKYPGFDPESNFDVNINGIPSLGVDYVQYPSSRTFLIGINFLL